MNGKIKKTPEERKLFKIRKRKSYEVFKNFDLDFCRRFTETENETPTINERSIVLTMIHEVIDAKRCYGYYNSAKLAKESLDLYCEDMKCLN